MLYLTVFAKLLQSNLNCNFSSVVESAFRDIHATGLGLIQCSPIKSRNIICFELSASACEFASSMKAQFEFKVLDFGGQPIDCCNFYVTKIQTRAQQYEYEMHDYEFDQFYIKISLCSLELQDSPFLVQVHGKIFTPGESTKVALPSASYSCLQVWKDNIWIVDETNARFIVVSLEGKVVKVCNIPSTINEVSSFSSTSLELVISDAKQHIIFFLDEFADVKRQLDCTKLKIVPSKIACSDMKLYVFDELSDQVFSFEMETFKETWRTGPIKRTTTGKTKDSPEQIHLVEKLEVTDSHLLAIESYGRIRTFNLDGQQLSMKFKIQSNACDQLPRIIGAKEMDGFLYIMDHLGSVHLYKFDSDKYLLNSKHHWLPRSEESKSDNEYQDADFIEKVGAMLLKSSPVVVIQYRA
jgi:hypothetical protein